MKMATRMAVSAGAVLLAGCNWQEMLPAAADHREPIDQASVCQVSTLKQVDIAKACMPGQKMVYLPQRFGNKQLPIIFAALNCDLRYSVALTNGAVTCIYAPATLKPGG